MIKVEYSSNNSGGSWWLKEKDWIALEKDGWKVGWGRMYFCHTDFSFQKPPKSYKPCCTKAEAGKSACQGHQRYKSLSAMKKAKDEGWLGAMAKEATLEVASFKEAVERFEAVTGKTASDEGCNCCGPPHSFSWEEKNGDHKYVSGEEILGYLYEDAFPDGLPSLREVAEARRRERRKD